MQANDGMSKVPAVTLGFWVIKIIATTLGETGGDAVSMTLNWGYALSSTMFIGVFAAAVAAQIAAPAFPSAAIWGCHYCDHDRRHDDGGFRGPVAGCRISRGIADPVGLLDNFAWRLVPAGRLDFGEHCRLTEN